MNLRALIISLFVFQVVIVTSYIFLYWKPAYTAQIEKRLLNSETATVKLLGPALVEPLLKGELSYIHAMLDEQRKQHPTWKKINLLNLSGRTVYPLNGNEETDFKFVDNLKLIRDEIKINGETIAQLNISVDLHDAYNEEEIALTNLLQFVVFLLIASAIIAAYTIDKLIATPVNQLANATKRVKSGDFSPSLPAMQNSEIGVLTKGFKDMMESLQATQASLKQHSARLQTVLDTVMDGIVVIDEKGIVESANSSASAIFGYREQDIKGRNISVLMDVETGEKHDEYVRSFLPTGKPRAIGKNRQLVGLRKTGETFPIELHVQDFWLDGKLKFVGTIRDITESLRNEKLKGEFVSTVSHELRTPLTAIKGTIDLVANGVTGPITGETRKILDMAKSNTDRLLLLINDILDISKIESGKLEFHFGYISVSDIIEVAIRDNQMYANQYKVNLSANDRSSGDCVHVDFDRVNQVMANLISNACKFSPSGSTVEVGAEKRDKMIRFYVHDLGSGIPDEFANRIFTKFAQADSSDTRKVGGTGLGLSICKALVERMNGTIGYFKNSDGPGTTFFFDLPVT